jgi:hypothetical protein
MGQTGNPRFFDPFLIRDSYDEKGCLAMGEGQTEVWFNDQRIIECLAVIISGLSLSQRNLTLSALDFQSMGLSKKRQIEAAIDRAAELGKVLDDLIKLLRACTSGNHYDNSKLGLNHYRR